MEARSCTLDLSRSFKKKPLGDLCSSALHHCEHQEKRCEGGKIYFGSWFQGSVYSRWAHSEAEHHGETVEEKAAHLMVTGK